MMGSASRSFSTVHIIGFPFAGGQGVRGVENTPIWLIQSGWFKDMKAEGKVTMQMLDIDDRQSNKDAEVDHDYGFMVKNRQNVFRNAQILKAATEDSLNNPDHAFTIVLGGDHSQAIGSITGFKSVYKDGRVIWVDAHIDVNSPKSSPSGNMHGMPVGVLTSIGESLAPPILRTAELAYFGIRDYEPEEEAFLNQNGILCYFAKDCDINKIPEHIQGVEKYFKKKLRKSHTWLSMDIDSLSDCEFMSTGTRVPDGLTKEYMLRFYEEVLPHCQGMDFSEVNWARATNSKEQDKDQETFHELFDKIVELTLYH